MVKPLIVVPPQSAVIPPPAPPEKESGFVNKMTGIGALGGALIATSIFPGSGAALLGLGALGGGCGHVTGKVKATKKLEQGEELSKPTFWNKDALLGGLIGLVSARVLTMGVLKMLAGMEIAGTTTAATAAFFASAPVMATVAAAITGAMVIGLYLGGRYGKKCAETEYETQMREKMSGMLNHQMAPTIINQLLGSGMDQVSLPEKNFAEQYLREQLMRSQQPQLPGQR